jgi:predicted DNA-binding protein
MARKRTQDSITIPLPRELKARVQLLAKRESMATATWIRRVLIRATAHVAHELEEQQKQSA